jgi:hypothetical protein
MLSARQMLLVVLAVELLAIAHAFSITPSQVQPCIVCFIISMCCALYCVAVIADYAIACIATYFSMNYQLRVSRSAWSSSNHAPRKAKQLPWTQIYGADRSTSTRRVFRRHSSSSDANANASETVNGAVPAPADTAVYERVVQQFLKALAKDEEQSSTSDTTTKVSKAQL